MYQIYHYNKAETDKEAINDKQEMDTMITLTENHVRPRTASEVGQAG
jgi:hypothetical protein